MLDTIVLPNGLKIANLTPHELTFWDEGWDAPVIAPPSGKVVNATPSETLAGEMCDGSCGIPRNGALSPCGCGQPGVAKLVNTSFSTQDSAAAILDYCDSVGALPVGSIIAAQAYPGRVVAMTPSPGYERVPAPLPAPIKDAILAIGKIKSHGVNLEQAEDFDRAYAILTRAINAPTKRMSPNKFTVYPAPLADGIYALKDGVSIRIDTFTWGYEGEAPVGASKVIEGKDGTKCLVYGHGTSYVTDGVIWSAE